MAQKKDYDEIKKTICGMCSKSCGVDIYLRDGKIVDVRGMKEHPMSHGVICGKARFAGELEFSKDRLTTPLLKQGSAWKKISWGEALDTAAKKLTEIKRDWGPEALAVYLGNSVGLRDAKRFAMRFCDVYGTPNYSSVDALCHWSRTMATDFTVGGYPVPDELNSKCIVIWGTNPFDSNVPEYNDILSAMKKGTKVIVIDPRGTSLAWKADVYVPIRPQTDCALALGMLNIIIKEKLFDKKFVDKWTVGFAQLKEHVKEYPPEKVAQICGVSTEVIYIAARTYAQNRPASLSQHIAIDHGINGFQTIRAITMLEAITANIDIIGGGKLTPGAKTNNTRPIKEISPKTIGLEKYPVFVKFMNQAQGMEFADTILTGKPYPIKAMILNGSNPLLTWPDAAKTEKALQKLDFLIVMDLFMTKTARMADLVLPASTFMERTELCDYGYFQGVTTLALRNKIFDPLPDTYPDWKFWLELANTMGYKDQFPWENNEDMLDFVLQPTGITVAKLKKNPEGVYYTQDKRQNYLDHGFNTPSGKIELYSERLAEYGYDPLPHHTEPLESPLSNPELFKKYPLCLLTGTRITHYWQSSFRNLPGPAALYPEPFVEINNDTAKKLGIKEGDRVNVETLRGSITIKAKINRYMRPDVVSIPLGWEKSNANMLTSYEGRDPITGYPAYKSLLCKIGKEKATE
jgi:formate dehydrogenase (coenzyme F420) alpha subunit